MNSFTMQSWDEHLVSGDDGRPRFAHAHATFGYTGTIEGTSTCDYLLYYAPDGQDGGVTSPGLERIDGSVDGRTGSFVIRHEVGFGADGVTGTWTVVPGSGTGELTTLSGHGTISGSSETMAYTFEHRL